MLNKFISYLEEQVRNHSVYVWGGQGEQGRQVSEAWIRKRENSTANAARAIAFWRKQVLAGYGDVLRAFDCSGLAVYFLLKEGLLSNDTTADGLMRKCARISQGELRRGDFVFKVDAKGKAYHVGYIVDDALNVIEAQGRDTGVIKSSLKGWNAYGRPPFFNAVVTPTPVPTPTPAPTPAPTPVPKSRVLMLVKPYLQGVDVAELQTALKKRGYAVGTIDGVFGPQADKALRKFQKAAKLVPDGKAGPKTYAALGLEWRG
ncbi:MAG: peptidoglycan-binding protein [Candidatus Pelethousia sp.]|nr:peptidoglycan-binding protein [Candidatus Pelethousia sp.]